jgi:hypothetical protein
MEKFKALYLEYCKNYNAEPQEAVKSELKRYYSFFKFFFDNLFTFFWILFNRMTFHTDNASFTFNLSSHHLTDKTCMILGKLLAHDQIFSSLLLNDCSISTDGVRDICYALCSNTSIKILEMKGNNIHGDGTESIAKLIRQNTSIKT